MVKALSVFMIDRAFFLVYTFVDGWVMGLDHLKGLQDVPIF